MENKKIEIKKTLTGGMSISTENASAQEIQNCIDKFKAMNPRRAVFHLPDGGEMTANVYYEDKEK